MFRPFLQSLFLLLLLAAGAGAQGQTQRFAALAARAVDLDSIATSDKVLRRFEYKEPEVFRVHWDTTKVHVLDFDWSQQQDTLWLCATDIRHRRYRTPVRGEVVSSHGWRHRRMHHGIDLKLTTGDTVFAAFDGKIRYSDYNYGGYGNLVVVRHFSGLETYYGHLSALFVDPNEYVKAGDPIGLGGSTGRSSGPHLHFEVRYMGSAFNPEFLIDFKTGALRDPNVLLHQGKWAYHKPKAASLSTADNEVLHEAPPAPSAVYRVKSGDTLYSIAKRNGTTVQELCRVNGIGERRPIYAGQRLRLK
ncbi:MAG: M23 family metallopeptidase [Schleiferiaceae bacterium]|nr:M23 family metallopeptidase [Schleiferiaceae bacterium]MDP4727851.1 M23 family metallopeptidase [Schleiferiaceae bacterium]MDP4749079.1 M23 family metallopeptidase [Schleiferiaceae bacterium]MDP4900811.1 M23 family metallopeptidase [Schleiferiaceae bacterium]